MIIVNAMCNVPGSSPFLSYALLTSFVTILKTLFDFRLQ